MITLERQNLSKYSLKDEDIFIVHTKSCAFIV